MQKKKNSQQHTKKKKNTKNKAQEKTKTAVRFTESKTRNKKGQRWVAFKRLARLELKKKKEKILYTGEAGEKKDLGGMQMDALSLQGLWS